MTVSGFPNTMSSWGGLSPPVWGDREQVMRATDMGAQKICVGGLWLKEIKYL